MERVKVILANKDIKAFREWCSSQTSFELAETLAQLNQITDQLLFFRLLQTEIASEVFTHIPTEQQKLLISNFSSSELQTMLDELYTDEVVDLIEEMPHNIAKRIYRNITNLEERATINKLLKYSDDKVGSIMSVNLVWLRANMSCAEALSLIKKQRYVSEIVSYFFVVDETRQVVGAISFEALFFEEETQRKITELTLPVETLQTMQPKEQAALVFANHDLPVLPVINSQGLLVGMVTADDVIDVLQKGSTEDIYKSAGISSEHVVSKNYEKTSVATIVKARFFWLVILMLGATLSQYIINYFQNHINDTHSDSIPPYLLTAIDSLIPVIAGTAGNAGSQSATTITRAIALGEAAKHSKVIKKEFLVGASIGALLCSINLIRLLLYYLITGQLLDSERYSKYLILSVTCSLVIFLVVVLSKLVGTIIPLLASRLKRDPAVMSSPTLTTVTDAFATLIFFALSILVLSYIF